MKPILHTLGNKGSGTGHSYYSSFASGCPLAAAYRHCIDDSDLGDGKSGRAIGTIAHAYQELYWKRHLHHEDELPAVQFDQTISDENRTEAERCFRYFRSIFPEAEALGKVLEVESSYPQSEIDRFILNELFKAPFTFRVDLVTELDSEHITRLKSKDIEAINGHLGHLEPGLWLWDFKHYGRRDTNLLDKTLGSTQYAAYIMAYNAVAPVQANGLIQIAIFTTKTMGMHITVIAQPPRALEMAVLQVVKAGATVPKTMVIPTENNCFPYFGGVCQWFTHGLCDRTGPTSSGLTALRNGGFTK